MQVMTAVIRVTTCISIIHIVDSVVKIQKHKYYLPAKAMVDNDALCEWLQTLIEGFDDGVIRAFLEILDVLPFGYIWMIQITIPG